MKADVGGWEEAYRRRPYKLEAPHPGVKQLWDRLRSESAPRMLDLGCGDGRHLVYLGGRGIWIVGLGRAQRGVRRAQAWLMRVGVVRRLTCADMVALPFASDFFDAVIAIQVVHHHVVQAIRTALWEVLRVLRPGGFILLTVARYPPSQPWEITYREVERRTYLPEEGFEKGVPHHLFSERELGEFLDPFEIEEIGQDPATSSRLLAWARKRP